MFARAKRSSFIAILAIALQACTSMNVRDFCLGADLTHPDTDSLGIVLGVAPHALNEGPFIVFNSPAQANPEQTLHIKLEPAPIPWPPGLDESACPSMDWRTYRLSVGSEEWSGFWNNPRPLPYEIGLGVFEYVVPMRKNEFALALIDKQTGEVLMRCGCYGT
jgi:hypothetical protein